MEALWGLVADELSKVETIGGQRYVDRHRKRGKMLARERIEQLVDPEFKRVGLDRPPGAAALVPSLYGMKAKRIPMPTRV